MTTLAHFPLVSQLDSPTADGRLAEDRDKSCVPASLCAGAMWLNNISQVGGLYTPDTFKDKVYKESWLGYMAARDFVVFCKNELGIKLYSLGGEPAQLVQWAREHVRAGHPVVFTIPWKNSATVTHVCVFYGEETGQLTCMDPLEAQPKTKSDQEWRRLLQDEEIWIMEKLMTLPLRAHDVVVNGDPRIVWDGSPYIIRGAIRAKYLDIASHGWIPPDDAPLGNEYDPSPEPLEYGVEWGPGGRRQDTQYISIGWSPSRGAKQIHVGAEYSRLRSNFISIEAAVASLQAQVADLQAKLASLPMPPE